MKKVLLLLSLVFASVTAFAQKSLNYQAVIMDPKPIEIPGTNITGQPLKNGKVSVRFALISKAGVDYEELHETMTDEFGLINLTIGAGLVNTSGIASNATTIAFKSFEAVKWDSNVKQLKVSLSFDSGKNFTVVSSQPFNYSAYSLYAESVEYKNVRDSPTTLSFFNNDVGYIVSKDLDPLKSEIDANQKENMSKFLIINQNISDQDKKLADQGKKIADNSNEIENTKSQMGNISITMNNQGNQITNLTNQGNSTQTKVDNLTTKVSVTEAKVQNLEGSYENVGNKSNNVQDDRLRTDKYPSVKAVKEYVDQSVLGVAQQKTVDGKEDKNNKSTNIVADQSSDDKYPSVKAIKKYVDESTLGTAMLKTIDGKEDVSNKTSDINDANARTKYPTVEAIKTYVDKATMGIALEADLRKKANTDSPEFTGTPKLPSNTVAVTQNVTSNGDTKIATTEYVQNSLREGAPDATEDKKGKLQLSGDLGGSAAAPIVTGIQGTDVSAEKPKTGDIMKMVDGVWKPTPYDAVVEEKQRLELTDHTLKITGTNVSVNLPKVEDATTAATGKIQIAGDLEGTALAPRVKGLTEKANLSSPEFSGTPKVPTISNSKDNSQQIANAAFVQAAITAASVPKATLTEQGTLKLAGDLAGSTDSDIPTISNDAITTVKILNEAVTEAKIGVGAVTETKLGSAAVTEGKIAAAAVSTGKIADGAVTDAKIVTVAGSKVTGDITGKATNITGTVAIVNGGTGVTSFANTYITKGSETTLSSVSSIPVADVTGAAPLASPALTGTPTAPTAAPGTNNTEIATTAFVKSAVTAGTPDASTTAKGIIQLGGDLAGSNNASAPKLTDGAVVAAKIGTAAVITDKIDALAVTTEKIAALAVTNEKLAGKISNDK
jgi:hypothetical protein